MQANLDSEEPLLVPVTQGCIGTVFVAIFFLQIAEAAVNRFGPAWKPVILPDILAYVLFLPPVIGFLLSFYTVAAYPDYVPAERRFPGRFNPVPRRIGGGACFLMAIVTGLAVLFSAELDTPLVGQIVLIGFFNASAFGGFLITSFDPDRHPVISSLLEQTLGLAIFLVPLYTPTLLIGLWRYHHIRQESANPLP